MSELNNKNIDTVFGDNSISENVRYAILTSMFCDRCSIPQNPFGEVTVCCEFCKGKNVVSSAYYTLKDETLGNSRASTIQEATKRATGHVLDIALPDKQLIEENVKTYITRWGLSKDGAMQRFETTLLPNLRSTLDKCKGPNLDASQVEEYLTRIYKDSVNAYFGKSNVKEEQPVKASGLTETAKVNGDIVTA